MVFKERLKEKRTEANLTQVELAEKAGVTARTIQIGRASCRERVLRLV